MSAPIAWALLFLSGLLDVAWAVSMKRAEGFTRPGWSLLSLVLLAAFIYSLGLALKILPMGTAYAVWAGVGVVGTAVIGICLFGESAGVVRLGSLALVMVGIAGLKLSAA